MYKKGACTHSSSDDRFVRHCEWAFKDSSGNGWAPDRNITGPDEYMEVTFPYGQPHSINFVKVRPHVWTGD